MKQGISVKYIYMYIDIIAMQIKYWFYTFVLKYSWVMKSCCMSSIKSVNMCSIFSGVIAWRQNTLTLWGSPQVTLLLHKCGQLLLKQISNYINNIKRRTIIHNMMNKPYHAD